MLTNFAKGFIINIWGGSGCASEYNSIKSYKIVAAEAIMKNEDFHNVEYCNH